MIPFNTSLPSSTGISKQISLSFFKDSLEIPKSIQTTSKTALILSCLEDWLNASYSLIPSKNYVVTKSSLEKNVPTMHLYAKEHTPIPLLKRVFLIIMKVLATFLIVPRLVAEIIRYGLRQAYNTKVLTDKLDLFYGNEKHIDDFIQNSVKELTSKTPLSNVQYIYAPSPWIRFKLPLFSTDLVFTIISHKPSFSSDHGPLDNNHLIGKEHGLRRLLNTTIATQNISESFLNISSTAFHTTSKDKLAYIVEDNPYLSEKIETKDLWTLLQKHSSVHVRKQANRALVALSRLLINTGLNFDGLWNFSPVFEDNKFLGIALIGKKEIIPEHDEKNFQPILSLINSLTSKETIKDVVQAAIEEKKRVSSAYLPPEELKDFCNRLLITQNARITTLITLQK